MLLSNKVALITGGASGIGYATAKRFVDEGARVVITGRDEQKLHVAKKELGDSVIAVRADAADLKQTEDAVHEAVAAFGGLDIVFANAGVSGNTPLGGTTFEAFDRIMRINVNGTFFTVQAASPHLRSGGAVILNGSVHAVLGAAGYSAYAASKAAVRAITRNLATELAPRKIRVNIVVPGATRTPIWNRLAPDQDAMQALEARYGKLSLLGRMAEATELANAVVFLASDASSAMTGAEITVDGGMTQSPSGWPVLR